MKMDMNEIDAAEERATVSLLDCVCEPTGKARDAVEECMELAGANALPYRTERRRIEANMILLKVLPRVDRTEFGRIHGMMMKMAVG